MINNFFLPFLFVPLFFSFNAVEKKLTQWQDFACGTKLEVQLYSELSNQKIQELRESIQKETQRLELIFSDYRLDSEVRQLTEKAYQSKVQLSPELWQVLSLAHQMAIRTKGAFDPTIGASTQAWRRAKYQNSSMRESAVGHYQSLVFFPKTKEILLKEKGIVLDLGSCAKGAILDHLMKTIRQRGISSVALKMGGEILLADKPPKEKGWPVILGAAKQIFSNVAISTSGHTQQKLADGTSHLLVLKGKKKKQEVTVLASTSLEADLWATALILSEVELPAGIENGSFLKHEEFSALTNFDDEIKK